jgi:hypothetical protein
VEKGGVGGEDDGETDQGEDVAAVEGLVYIKGQGEGMGEEGEGRKREEKDEVHYGGFARIRRGFKQGTGLI